MAEIEDPYQALRECARIVGGPPDEIARVIWASIHGWMALELLGIGAADDQAAGCDRLCRSILAGLVQMLPLMEAAQQL